MPIAADDAWRAGFRHRVRQVKWEAYDTIYGNAAATTRAHPPVVELFDTIVGEDEEAADEAETQLCCALWHLDTMIGSFAAPALPLLFELLARGDQGLRDGVLESCMRFARATSHWLPREPVDEPRWMRELRDGLLANRATFESFLRSPLPDEVDLAGAILEALDGNWTASDGSPDVEVPAPGAVRWMSLGPQVNARLPAMSDQMDLFRKIITSVRTLADDWARAGRVAIRDRHEHVAAFWDRVADDASRNRRIDDLACLLYEVWGIEHVMLYFAPKTVMPRRMASVIAVTLTLDRRPVAVTITGCPTRDAVPWHL